MDTRKHLPRVSEGALEKPSNEKRGLTSASVLVKELATLDRTRILHPSRRTPGDEVQFEDAVEGLNVLQDGEDVGRRRIDGEVGQRLVARDVVVSVRFGRKIRGTNRDAYIGETRAVGPIGRVEKVLQELMVTCGISGLNAFTVSKYW